MPDWSYQPLFKPLLFKMMPDRARRWTFLALELQSRSRLGRALFRALSPAPPPPSAAFERMGLRFPSRIGLGEGLDPEAWGRDLLEAHFGFGFIEWGPAGLSPVEPDHATHPLRIPERRALIRSAAMAGPSLAQLGERLGEGSSGRPPRGLRLRGPDLPGALKAAEGLADFFTFPTECGADADLLVRLRAITDKPLLLALPLSGSAMECAKHARAAGWNGWISGEGAPVGLLPEGSWDGPDLLAPTLAQVARLREVFGSEPCLIASGGAEAPEDAQALIQAGADLVSLGAGFVYAGPGLAHRTVRALASPPPRDTPDLRTPPPSSTPGWWLIAFTGWMLIASGLIALALAATIELLPPDERFLGMTVPQLCSLNACRIVHFMAHDRVSFGGSILAIGIIYHWMARHPLRSGEPWAWWSLLLSGLCGFASFLTYLGYGYLDPWHATATLALLPVFLAGMSMSWSGLRRPRGIREMFRIGAPAWAWSPANLGRLGVGFAAFGMLSGGLTIMMVGMTRVFVPTDLTFMGTTIPQLNAINPRLIPLIAHDRAGFGGGLFSGGIAIMACIWCGARPGARGLWWALLLSGLAGFGTAIGVHPVVGYTSFAHLLPAYLGAFAFLWGMAQLHRPMCLDPAAPRFKDL